MDSVKNGALMDPKLWKEMQKSTGEGLIDKPLKYACPCFSFVLKDESMVEPFKQRLLLWEYCTSLGGVASSFDHRHKWHHETDVREMRLSVGVENVQDLIDDLERAMEQ